MQKPDLPHLIESHAGNFCGACVGIDNMLVLWNDHAFIRMFDNSAVVFQ